jgi:hypothetical protein
MNEHHYVPQIEAREAWSSLRRLRAIAGAFKPGEEYAQHSAAFRKHFLKWVNTMQLAPLERAAVYGLLQVFTGMNREAEGSAKLWTKEFTDETEETGARASGANKPDTDGRAGLQKPQTLQEQAIEVDRQRDSKTPPGWRVL